MGWCVIESDKHIALHTTCVANRAFEKANKHFGVIYYCSACFLLIKAISKCRDEEVEHKDIGINHGAESVSVTYTWSYSSL